MADLYGVGALELVPHAGFVKIELILTTIRCSGAAFHGGICAPVIAATSFL